MNATRIFLGVATVLSLTACGKPAPSGVDIVSQTDRDRAAVLSADKVFANTIGGAIVAPGRVRSEKLGWDRTEVRARLYDFQQPATAKAALTPATVEGHLAAILTTLRSEGWNVHFALCTPPPPIPEIGEQAPVPVHIPGEVLRTEGWQWVAFAYRVQYGVSYFALVSAALDEQTRHATIDIVLRAPQERDPADLFTDRPRGIGAGKSCADDAVVAKGLQQSGTPEYLRDWFPFPGESHTPQPSRR